MWLAHLLMFPPFGMAAVVLGICLHALAYAS